MEASKEFREDIEKMDGLLKGLKIPPAWSLSGT